MTDDLVKQLREVGRDYDFHENALVYSAAARIEALTAENERLRAALGKVRFLAQVNYEQNDNLNSRGRRDLLRIVDCARAALGDTQ